MKPIKAMLKNERFRVIIYAGLILILLALWGFVIPQAKRIIDYIVGILIMLLLKELVSPRMRRVADYGLAIIILLLIWELVSLGITAIYEPAKANALPRPPEALGVLIKEWKDLGQHFLWSAFRVVSSLLLALGLAAPLGLIVGHEKAMDRRVAPFIYITFPIPIIVFLPLLFIFLGIGEAPKLTLITLILAFPILLAARDSAKNIPKDYITSVLASGANRLQVYRHVVLPASLPAVLTSARTSISIGIAALCFAETFNIKFGLVYFIIISYDIMDYKGMFAGIMALSLLGLLLYAVLDLIERVLCRWNHLPGSF